MRGRRYAALLAALICAGATGVSPPIKRAVVSAAIDALLGLNVSMRELRIGGENAVLLGVHVERRGRTVFDADRVELSYRPRDVLPGGATRFGLVGFTANRPVLRITRESDGTLNLPSIVTRLFSPAQKGSSGGKPLRFTGVVENGSVFLEDPSRRFAASREQRVDHINARFAVDSAALTHYDASADFEDGRAQPLRLVGTIDRERGFAQHHFSAQSLSLPAALNYVLNTNAAVVVDGAAHAVDVRVYAPSIDADGRAVYHMSGNAEASGGILRIAGFRKPLRNLHGRFDIFDDGVVVRDVQGTLANVPVVAFGGIYGLSHPKFRLFVNGSGTLEKMRSAFVFSARYPVRGPIAFTGLLEGSVSDPLVSVRFSSQRLAYDRYSVTRAGGLLVYYNRGIDLIPASVRYGGAAIAARGHIDLDAANHMVFAVESNADAVNLPYAAQIMPHARLHGDAAVFGPAAGLQTWVLADGGGGGDALFALLHVDERGEGTFAPISVARADGSALAGAFYLDPLRNESAFWTDVKRYRFIGARGQSLPGLEKMGPPNFSGVVSGVAGGAGSASSFAVVGRARAVQAQSGTVRLDEVAASFAGSPANLHIGNLQARGPWGNFAGSGGYAENGLALDGGYVGSFERLRAFTGELGARGGIVSHVALLIDPKRLIVQTREGKILGATVRGVPVDALSGTLEMRGKRLRIDEASVGVAGGNLAGAGEVGEGVGVSASGVRAERLGVPLQGGRLTAIGLFGDEEAPRFEGGILLNQGAYAGHNVEAGVNLALRGDAIRLTRSQGSVDGTYALVDGRLTNVGERNIEYDLRLSVHGADVEALSGQANVRGIDGNMDADLRVFGRGSAPRVEGELRMPEGSINGLRFQDALADIDVMPASARAEVREGSVTVKSTHAKFSGGVARNDAWVRIDAPEADLADFNDFFDVGDTFGGTGRIFVDFEKRQGAYGMKTDADVAMKGLRYRDFPLGDTAAFWKTRGDTATGQISFGGASGRLFAGGSIALAHGATLQETAARSRYDVTTRLQDLDLGAWAPIAGYHVPLLGRVNANAVARGRYPNILLAGTANMEEGSAWGYPVDQFTVSMSSNGNRTMIDGITLDLPSLSVRGAGSFGLRATDPLVLDVHAGSTNIGSVLTRAIARGRTVFGTLDADMHVSGTRGNPRVAGSFDVENAGVRGVVLPRIVGALGIDAGSLVIHDAEVDFQQGRIATSGTVPFTGSPPRIGPGSARVRLNLAAERLDLSAFQPLLPAESKLGGVLDGLLSVDGAADAPRLHGKLGLDAGTLLTPFEKTPLRNIVARVSFGKSKVRLTTLHADAGNGTLDARGTITIADLMQLTTDAAYSMTVDAKHAQLDFPAYGEGVADGTITVEHTPREITTAHGGITLNDALIPFAALYHPSRTASVNPPRFDLALNIDAIAARNVRVRSSNMDIGAGGKVNVGGTLSDPKLSGAFTSSGGTITYFNRIFRVLDGTVTFERNLGITPSLDARATTHVFDPMSVTGATDITLTLTGPVTHLNIALDSDPSYDREQILALLLNEPQLGALLSGGVNVRGGNGNQVVGAEAFGLIDAQFTRALLTPLETTFGQALGLSTFNVNFNYGGAVNVSARKVLGKTVNLVYASDVSYPYRQSFGFEMKPNKATSAQVTFYQALAQTGLDPISATNIASSTNRVLLSQPLTGTNGFSFTFLQYLR